ncbi:MAG: hypothetical protein SH820_07105 [Xanthomonadales bacterium]|nr:hypothetical protein [Xanthomonadales bacterium]
MSKIRLILVALFLLAAARTNFADAIEGAWLLESYQLENESIPVNGIIIFAKGYFSTVYKMDYEGSSGRSHGGRYNLEGDEITYTIPWWVQNVAGTPEVMKNEILAKGRVELTGNQLIIRYASGSVHKFTKLTSGEAGELGGAWLMESYESPAKTGPASGMMIFSGDRFAMIYTMKTEDGLDGRAHAGAFHRNGGAMSLSVDWSMQAVGGVGSVQEGSVARESKANVAGDLLILELGGDSVQKFRRVKGADASR